MKKTNETSKSTRELALEWWDDLFYNQQQEYNYRINGDFLNWLKPDQIEELFKKETELSPMEKMLEDKDYVPKGTFSKLNQKQFKEFNPQLFKSYIDKFSDEDKITALRIMFKSIGLLQKINLNII